MKGGVSVANSKLELVFDENRAIEVFGRIAKCWRNRELEFAKSTPPERSLPENVNYGSRLHGIWLAIYAICNSSGDQSDTISSSLKTLWIANPDLFDPNLRLSSDPTLLIPSLPYANVYPARTSRWMEFRQYIKDELEGDLRSVFLQFDDREELISHFEQFKGIGQKIAQMLGMWFQDVEWDIEYQNQAGWQRFREMALVPADRHLMRKVIQCGIISHASSDHHRTISRPISDFVAKVCEENRISWSDLSQGFWHIGAKICRKRPKRKNDLARSSAYCFQNCPIEHFCTHTITEGKEGIDKTGKVGFWRRVEREAHLFSRLPDIE